MPRLSLRGWLGKVRADRWPRLFLFEFFVVLLGVLAAQGLQSWFSARAEQHQAAVARAALDRDLRSLGLSAAIRDRLRFCTYARLARIQASIAQGEAPDQSVIAPDEALVVDFGWSGRSAELVSDHFGNEVAERYTNISLWADALQRAQRDEQASWDLITATAPTFGPPSPDDLSAAKRGVAGALMALQRINYATINIRRNLAEADIDLDLSELSQLSAPDALCSTALSHPSEDHEAAAQAGRLVTGQSLLPE